MSILNSRSLGIGVALAIISNVLFGTFYVYGAWLAPMTGTQVFVWRLLAMFAVVVVYLLASGQHTLVMNDLKAIHQKNQWLIFLAPTPIMLSQLWLFMWAPLNNEGVAVAMGYFLFPLVMVLAGVVVFGERLSALQKLATTLAAIGVAMELVQGGSLSWATFWVCLTYPIYYIMRRRQGVRAITGLFVDCAMFLPMGVAYLVYDSQLLYATISSFAIFKVLGLGALSVLAFMANLQAVRLLPVSLFGMLSYLEPLLLFLVAIVFLGEPLTMQMLLSYGLIWLGIMCLIVHGVLINKRRLGQE